MLRKIFILICLCGTAFSEQIPESVRMECAQKIHRAFALQSVGQSTAAFYAFKDGYQQALTAGVSPKKMYALGSYFNWYRKYGHYLGIFIQNPEGNNRITDEYWERRSNSSRLYGSDRDYLDRIESDALKRDLLFGTAEVIGGLLGVIFIQELTIKGGAVVLACAGIERIWDSYNRLKAKNDKITHETKMILDQMKAAAAAE
jgi:hypothetical protein